jgi:transglycosylase-like protein with SLT domain
MRLVLLAACIAVLGVDPATAVPRKGAPAAAVQDEGPGALCRRSIQAAEREHRLPPSLLMAIGRVESGRIDSKTRSLTPWPWTINAEGQGRHFETREEAIAAVEALQARGIRVIDVGCMQVNLHHHPAAFADLQEAFDPVANARYAGLFLKRLQAARGDWEIAASHYHSATPERADAYRLKVLANWPGMAHRLAAEQQRQALAGTAPSLELSQREAMIAAWGGGARTIRVNGFHQRALALNQRPMLNGTRERGLLDPIPPIRVVGRQPGGRPVYSVELAEAAPARR